MTDESDEDQERDTDREEEDRADSIRNHQNDEDDRKEAMKRKSNGVTFKPDFEAFTKRIIAGMPPTPKRVPPIKNHY